MKINNLKDQLLTANEEQKIEILFSLIDNTKEKNPTESLMYAEIAYKLSQDLKLKEKKIDALIAISLISLNLGKTDEALINFKKASRESLNIGYTRAYIKSLIGTGNTYLMLNSYDYALEYFLRAMKISEEIDYESGYISALNNISIIYSMNNENKKALENFKLALKIHTESNDSIRMANASVNIGNVYIKIDDYENAINYFKSAVQIFENKNQEILLASALSNMGTCYLGMKDYINALNNYEKSLMLSEKYNDLYGIASVCTNLGAFYLEISNFEKASQYYEKSLRIALKIKSIGIVKECYGGFYQISLKNNNYKNALKYLTLFEAYEDSIFNQEKQKRITELKTTYEIEKKEQEIELLQTRTELKEKQAIILSVIVTFLVVLAILLTYFYRTRNISLRRKNLILSQDKELNRLLIKNKEAENLRLHEEMKAKEEINLLKEDKYQEQIKHKNRELSTTTLQIVNKNEILNTIKKSLYRIKESNAPLQSNVLSSLIKEVEKSVKLDSDWEKFKMHFEEVHQGFFERLLNNYPDITTGDQKLCAYLKINLDSKEISKVINITLAALEKRRHRLRKKLNLDANVNLVEFLNKI